MKVRIFSLTAILLCAVLILGLFSCAKPESIPQAVTGYTEAQCAALVWGEGVSAAFRGCCVVSGTACDRYLVTRDGQSLGYLATADGTWYADPDGNGRYAPVLAQDGKAVLGDELAWGDAASAYLKWENGGLLSADDRENYSAVFDAVYPALIAAYGRGDAAIVTVRVSPDADADAGAQYQNGEILLHPGYLASHPNGYDCLIPAIFTAICPSVDTDTALGGGLALFCRIRYGVFNTYIAYSVPCDTSLPVDTDAACAAVFLNWICERLDYDFTQHLCRALQNGQTDGGDVWEERIGFSYADAQTLYHALTEREASRREAEIPSRGYLITE